MTTYILTIIAVAVWFGLIVVASLLDRIAIAIEKLTSDEPPDLST